MNKHLLKPWQVGENKAMIFGPDGKIVADAYYVGALANPGRSQADREEIAAHIVKCVNMHEELVEFLQFIVTSGGDMHGHIKHEAKELLARVEAE